MPENTHKQKITVETLLRIKKSERPEAEFWDNFDRDFDRRRLHELVNRPSWRDMFIRPAFKAIAMGVPALAMIAIALVWTPAEKQTVSPLVISDDSADLSQPEQVIELASIETSRPEPSAVELALNGATSQFVVDSFQEEAPSAARFRKVLYTPAIRLSVPSGAFYVRDNLSSHSYEVTTADVKLGRNF